MKKWWRTAASGSVVAAMAGASLIMTATPSQASAAPVIEVIHQASTPEGLELLVDGSFTDVGSTSWTATVDYGAGAGVTPLALAPDRTFKLSHAYSDNGNFVITVRVTDEAGATGTATLGVEVVNIEPGIFAGRNARIREGDRFNRIALFNDPGADQWVGDVLWGDGSAIETLELQADRTFLLDHVFVESGTYASRIRVFDDDGGMAINVRVIFVANLAATVGPLKLSSSTVLVGNPVGASAPFVDPGVVDTHTAEIAWGDGTTSLAEVTETNGAGTALGQHAFSAAGRYPVTLTVTDDEGAVGAAAGEVVVIDPTAGRVVGGGWVSGATGAKTTFSLGARYQGPSLTPSGETTVRDETAGIRFRSTALAWLAVDGDHAEYEGTGVLNGVPGYRFRVALVDQAAGDRVRVRIWDRVGLVYDSIPAGDENATAPLGGGNLTVQR